MDGRDEIADAISEQAHKFAYFHTFGGNAHEQQIKLGERLMHILPGNMSKVLFASSGSEANDANVKMAWMYQFLRGKPEKRKIIARHMGYYGITTVGASLSGLPLMHAPFGLPLPGFLHTDKGHYYWEGQPDGDQWPCQTFRPSMCRPRRYRPDHDAYRGQRRSDLTPLDPTYAFHQRPSRDGNEYRGARPPDRPASH